MGKKGLPLNHPGEKIARGMITVHTVVDGIFRQTNLTNESADYLAKREELRLAEIEPATRTFLRWSFSFGWP